MATTKNKTPEALEAAAKKKAEAEKKKAEATANTVETTGPSKESVKESAVHQFDPKKLRGSDGLWKYIADPESVSRETFLQRKAKDYGIKENDVVIVSFGGNVKTFGV